MSRFPLLLCLLLLPLGSHAAVELIWPTPNPAFAQRAPLDDFIQPTASGEVSSGLFGCVRNNGRRFHEGIDLKPYLERKGGEPTDPVYAAMDGVVAHAARRNGQSSYGRYVVIEHERDGVLFYTLYAHLASVDSSMAIGSRVSAGDVVGVMGRSATGYSIPRSRAHLHFEIGLRLGDSFQEWYDRQKFGSPNFHRNYNGMNLTGFDPLAFFKKQRDEGIRSMSQYIDDLPTAYVLRVRTTKTPPFVRWNPALVGQQTRGSGLAGWEIEFTAFGLPKQWKALTVAELGQQDLVSVVDYDPTELNHYGCRKMIQLRSGKAALTGDGMSILEHLFGRL